MRVRTLAAALVAAVVVAGCGGSSSPSSTTAKKTTATKKKATTPPKTVSTSSTAGSTSTSGTSSTPTFASDTNCLKLGGVSTQFAKALAAETGAKFNETAAAADFQKLADAAPSAIRPDLETIASAFNKFATAFKNSGYEVGKTPTAAQAAALASAVQVFDTSSVKSAETALQAWTAKNCS